MEDVKALRETLERVEGRLIAAGKVYGAMNYAVWLMVMAGYYVLAGAIGYGPVISTLYWITGAGTAAYITMKIWGRYTSLHRNFGSELKASRTAGLVILTVWITGAIIGFVLIPSSSIGANADARFGVGLLTFIGLSLLGQWLVMTGGKGEFEMVPAALLPLLGIPIAWNLQEGATVWAGFLITLGFGTTILLYLYSAFKAIER